MNRDELPRASGLAGFSIHTQLQVQGTRVLGKGYSQVLEISLQPGVMLSTQPGQMVHFDPYLTKDVEVNGVMNAARRAMAGEHPIKLNFTNNTNVPRTVAVANTHPGSIVAIDLSRTAGFVFKRGAFLAAFGRQWQIRLRLASNLGVACCGGQGAILSEITGNGVVFLTGCGSILERYLQPGETITVDTAAVLGYDTQMNQTMVCLGDDLATWCCSGSSAPMVSRFVGPGRLLLQSYPIERLRALMPQNSNGGSGGGGGDGGGGGGG